MTKAGKTIFISYCGEAGMSQARRISTVLAGSGYDAYVPIKPIWESEAEWDDELMEIIRSADGVIFVEPDSDSGAGHVLFEVGAARALGKRVIGVGRPPSITDLEETVSETILHSFPMIEVSNLSDDDLARAVLRAFA